MDHFNPFKVRVPVCPTDNKELIDAIGYPSIVIVYCVLGVTCFFFAIWTAIKYNSVEVYTEKVRRPHISNTLWIIYFLSLVLRSAADAVRFALADPQYRSVRDLLLVLVSLVLSGVCTFLFTLALNHQRRHRSAFAHVEGNDATKSPSASASLIPKTYPKTKSPTKAVKVKIPQSQEHKDDSDPFVGGPVDGTPLLSINEVKKDSKVKQVLKGIETPLFILLILYFIAIYAEFTMAKTDNEPIFWIILMVTWGIQRVPVVVLLLLIVSNHKETEGPSVASKVLLVLASLIYLVNDLPISVWAEMVHETSCVFKIGSSIDLIHVLYVLAQILFFIFLRMEYHRNKEECIWRIVSERGNGFDFRDFKG